MSALALDRIIGAVPAPSAALGEPMGHAFIVQLEPDLACGERINVGVCVVANNGERIAKFVSDFGRLECLYGTEATELIETLVEFARASVLSGDRLASRSVLTSTPQPFFNASPPAYAEQLFSRVVPAGLPRRDGSIQDRNRDTDALWRQVGDAIKLRAPEMAEQILSSSPYTTVNTPRGPRQVCVPLTPVGAAGALESADFSISTTRLKLMRAVLDVETAAAAKQLPRLGLFIARPARVRKESDLRAIDGAIDYVASRVPATCRVEVEADVTVLANHILDWAELRAA
jgi:hypothetical protein